MARRRPDTAPARAARPSPVVGADGGPLRLSLWVCLGLLLAGAVSQGRAQTRPAPSLAPSASEGSSQYEVSETPAFTRAVRGSTRSRDGRPGPQYWQQSARYRIRARLDTASHRIVGHEQVTYLNRSPDTLNRLAVHLRQNLFRGASARRRSLPETGGVALHRVAVQQTSLPRSADSSGIGYRVEGTVAWLRLPSPLPPSDSVSLQFDWAYTPPPAPADGRQGREGRVYYAGYWYPQIAVYDDVHGWVAEPYTGQAEFYMGQADYDVRLSVPAHWRVGATGQLQNASAVLSARSRRRLRRARRTGDVVPLLSRGERGTGRATRAPDDSLATWHFRAESVRDFAWGTSDQYLWDATRALVPTPQTPAPPPDTVMIHSLYRPHQAAAAWPHAAQYTAEAVTALSATLRPYPYRTMTSMEGILRGGGMEYPMVTIMQPWADTLKLAGDLMHEVGHMWVPMEVGTNEKRYVWMDEGLTQFNTAQGMRRLYGPGPRPSGRASDSETGQRQTYLQIARRDDRVPLMQHGDDIPAPLYFDLPYDKAAQVLAALRGVLGPSTFRRAYDAFYDRWWGRHPTPYDFFNTIADVTGRDLSWFWTTWFYRTSPLDQALASVRAGPDSTTITIENRGRAPMPVPLTIRRADGSTTERTVPVDVWLGGETRHRVTVPGTPAVVRVEIDAAGHFPDLDRSNQVWRRDR